MMDLGESRKIGFGFHSGGELPRFHQGGLASDERNITVQTGERVLSREQNKEYEAFPRFHSGGYVYPAFQAGGEAQEGMVQGSTTTYTGSTGGTGASGEQTRAVYSSITSLSSSMSTLSQDVSKVASGFSALGRSAAGVESSSNRLSSTLSSASGAVSGFQSILNLVSGGKGGESGGLGGIGSAIGGLGTITKLFGFAQGGEGLVKGSGGTDSQLVQFMATPGEQVMVLTPQQQQQAQVGGLPRFATGGSLTVGHQLAPVISEFVHGATSASTGGLGQGDVNIHMPIGSINGVMNAHDVRRLLMNEFSSVARGMQRAARNNFEFPGGD